jgi:HEPN domain-containing protein
MPPELELIQQWLQRVDVDLRSAEVDLAASPPITDDACFHCQQAVERLLRAFLTYHGVEFDYIHEIEQLIKQCETIDSSFSALHNSADRLTGYAVRFRYPYSGAAPGIDQSRQALGVARTVHEFVLHRLPPEVGGTT